MDEYIIHKLYGMQPGDSQAVIELLGKYDPAGEVIIRDPLFVRIVHKILYKKRRSYLLDERALRRIDHSSSLIIFFFFSIIGYR